MRLSNVSRRKRQLIKERRYQAKKRRRADKRRPRIIKIKRRLARVRLRNRIQERIAKDNYLYDVLEAKGRELDLPMLPRLREHAGLRHGTKKSKKS